MHAPIESAFIPIPGSVLSIPFELLDSLSRAIREWNAQATVRQAEVGGALTLRELDGMHFATGAAVLPGPAGEAAWRLVRGTSLPPAPFGIFRTNTRQSASLSAEDLQLCARVRPAVFCLIRPFATRPHECSVFAPDRYHPESAPNAEFLMDRAVFGGGAVAVADHARVPQTTAPLAGPVGRRHGKLQDNSSKKWLLLTLFCVAFGSAGGYAVRRLLPAGFSFATEPGFAPIGSRLRFTATADGKLVTLKWDSASAVAERSTGGSLWISDAGNVTTRDLTLAQIRTGLFVYPAVGDHLVFRLAIRSDREQVTESLNVNAVAP